MKNYKKNEMDCGLDPLSWTQRLENWFLNHFLYVPSTSVSECKDTVEEKGEPLKESASGGSSASPLVDTLPSQYSGSTGSVDFIQRGGITYTCPQCWNKQPNTLISGWPAKCVYCGKKFHDVIEDLI